MRYEKVEVGSLVTLRQGFAINKKTSHHMSEEPTRLHLLRIGDMKEGTFSVFVKDTIPTKFIAKEDDIIYTRTGQVGLVFRRQYGVIHNNCFTVTTNNPEVLRQQFLYYALQEKSFYEEANSRATGAAQPDLPHGAFNSIQITLPPVEKQDRITDILDAYEALIDNNQRQIKLLEEAAQRLYKEWFVDLRFPGYENTPIVDGVPEGWRIDTVGGICTLKKETVSARQASSGTPYIGLEHMPRVDFCLSSWGDAEGVASNKFRYTEDDIIFGKIRPYFHKVGFALNSGVVSTDSFVMKAADGLWGLLLMTVFDKAFVDYTYQPVKKGLKCPEPTGVRWRNIPFLSLARIYDANSKTTFGVLPA